MYLHDLYFKTSMSICFDFFCINLIVSLKEKENQSIWSLFYLCYLYFRRLLYFYWGGGVGVGAECSLRKCW